MRVLAIFAAFGVFLVVAGFVFLNLVVPEDKSTPADCPNVSLPTAAEWKALKGTGQASLRTDLEVCGEIEGLSRAEVVAAFGDPVDGGTTSDGLQAMKYEIFDNGEYVGGQPYAPDEWELFLRDDAVVDTDYKAITK